MPRRIMARGHEGKQNGGRVNYCGPRGYRVTRPLRAIADLLRSGEVHPGLLEDGLREGMEKGLITIGEVRHALTAGLLPDLKVDVR